MVHVDPTTWLHVAIIAYLVLRDVVLVLRHVILALGGTVPETTGDGGPSSPAHR